ncbi:hypothetical protein [Brevundimonas faecalis]|uniref:Terminase small subunit n=1 Tax=Brevundimonas faecalis TaxID=947378 RepID=A0ABV2RCL5_9CAUL
MSDVLRGATGVAGATGSATMQDAFLLDAEPARRWVSVSEAASLEGKAGRPINKSSISRFIARNEDLPVRRDAQGRVKEVDYDALVRARGESLSVQDSREAPEAPKLQALPAGSRKRALEEEKLELDLAERKGELLSKAAITMAVEAMGVAFTQALERRRRGLATEISGIGDVRQAELALKQADQKLLGNLVKELTRLATGAADDEQAAA